MISKLNQALKYAYEKGYRVVDGKAYNPTGRELKLCVRKKENNYLYFGVKYNGACFSIFVHRMVGYQKYKDKMFEEGLLLRHLNSNSLDNSEKNILIGTASDNMMDIDVNIRRLRSSNANKIHNHKEIIELHKSGKSYSDIMRLTGIKSKGTISFIIRESMESAG